MKKVYLVAWDWVKDCECYNEVFVFSTLDKARKMFKKIVDDEKEYEKDLELVVEENKDSYTSYEDGEYSNNHWSCYILTKEVDKDYE